MSLTQQNIIPEQAATLNLSIQVSQTALQYGILSDTRIERAGMRNFNRDKSIEENLAITFEALPELHLTYQRYASFWQLKDMSCSR